jgi:hypothetical protein
MGQRAAQVRGRITLLEAELQGFKAERANSVLGSVEDPGRSADLKGITACITEHETMLAGLRDALRVAEQRDAADVKAGQLDQLAQRVDEVVAGRQQMEAIAQRLQTALDTIGQCLNEWETVGRATRTAAWAVLSRTDKSTDSLQLPLAAALGASGYTSGALEAQCQRIRLGDVGISAPGISISSMPGNKLTLGEGAKLESARAVGAVQAALAAIKAKEGSK